MINSKDELFIQALSLNPNPGNYSRQKSNTKKVEVFNVTRKTKLTLCLFGSWATFMPPYNIARLVGLTRESGYDTTVYDFNVESRYRVAEANPDLKDAWVSSNFYWWLGEDYYNKIHPTYKPILDSYVDQLLKDDVDIIGFSVYYTNDIPTNYVVKEIKKRRPDITIIYGGSECHQVNFKPIPEVDYYFIGEGEQLFIDFLNNWEQGIKPEKKAIGSLFNDVRIDLDSLPFPDYSDFDLDLYLGKGSICAELSRGCIARCSYCTEVYSWKYRDRNSKRLLDELSFQVEKYNIGFVNFVDSLINGNLKMLKDFCEGMIERNLNIKWWGYQRVDGRMDLEFYQLMAKAGAKGFNYGVESGSQKVLDAINKKCKVWEINENMINAHKAGILFNACWIIGAPGEDIEAFNHSFNLIWNHRERIESISPGIGLGDSDGSDYDNREKYNINPRNRPFLFAWWDLNWTNTLLHRQIRTKIFYMFIHLCAKEGGALKNHWGSGAEVNHFKLTLDDPTYIVDSVEYEAFDFNIIKTDLGVFADSIMNEVFNLYRMIWRVKGGFEITLEFNKEIDDRDFAFSNLGKNGHDYTATHWFKIDIDGNYSVKSYHNFKHNAEDIKRFGEDKSFEYTYESNGKWDRGTIELFPLEKPTRKADSGKKIIPITVNSN